MASVLGTFLRQMAGPIWPCHLIHDVSKKLQCVKYGHILTVFTRSATVQTRQQPHTLARKTLTCYGRTPSILQSNLGTFESALSRGVIFKKCQQWTDTSSATVETPVRHFATEAIKAKVRGIQKDISPLTTKRVVRRKKTKDSVARDQEIFELTAYAVSEECNLESLREEIERDPENKYSVLKMPSVSLFDVTAYATAEEIALENLKADLEKQGLYGSIKLPADAVDALHVTANYRIENETREIFIFREGSVVFWNMPEVERMAVLKFLRRHQQDSYDNLLIQNEYEHVEYIYSDGSETNLVGDEIQLQKPKDVNELDIQLEKYAFSNALALSVKLAIWEASLARYVDSIEWVLQDLKDGKKVRMSRPDVLRKTGELFTLRHLINLSSDLLDTPDFYWDRENLEQLYLKTCNHLNINKRTRVMNEKLTHCCELADLLTNHLNDKHHTRLEWMIIILIMVEVVFEIVHLVERYV